MEITENGEDFFCKMKKLWVDINKNGFSVFSGGARRRDAMQCIKYQPDFGVPVLYGIKLYGFFDDSDWEEVKNIYNGYSEEMDKKYK